MEQSLRQEKMFLILNLTFTHCRTSYSFKLIHIQVLKIFLLYFVVTNFEKFTILRMCCVVNDSQLYHHDKFNSVSVKLRCSHFLMTNQMAVVAILKEVSAKRYWIVLNKSYFSFIKICQVIMWYFVNRHAGLTLVFNIAQHVVLELCDRFEAQLLPHSILT